MEYEKIERTLVKQLNKRRTKRYINKEIVKEIHTVPTHFEYIKDRFIHDFNIWQEKALLGYMSNIS